MYGLYKYSCTLLEVDPQETVKTWCSPRILIVKTLYGTVVLLLVYN